MADIIKTVTDMASKVSDEDKKKLTEKATAVVQKEVADVKAGEKVQDSVKDAAKELSSAASSLLGGNK